MGVVHMAIRNFSENIFFYFYHNPFGTGSTKFAWN